MGENHDRIMVSRAHEKITSASADALENDQATQASGQSVCAALTFFTIFSRCDWKKDEPTDSVFSSPISLHTLVYLFTWQNVMYWSEWDVYKIFDNNLILARQK
jgi:hypothetical protein